MNKVKHTWLGSFSGLANSPIFIGPAVTGFGSLGINESNPGHVYTRTVFSIGVTDGERTEFLQDCSMVWCTTPGQYPAGESGPTMPAGTIAIIRGGTARGGVGGSEGKFGFRTWGAGTHVYITKVNEDYDPKMTLNGEVYFQIDSVNGLDEFDSGHAAKPFKTIGYAIQELQRYDLNMATVHFQMKAGTYDSFELNLHEFRGNGDIAFEPAPGVTGAVIIGTTDRYDEAALFNAKLTAWNPSPISVTLTNLEFIGENESVDIEYASCVVIDGAFTSFVNGCQFGLAGTYYTPMKSINATNKAEVWVADCGVRHNYNTQDVIRATNGAQVYMDGTLTTVSGVSLWGASATFWAASGGRIKFNNGFQMTNAYGGSRFRVMGGYIDCADLYDAEASSFGTRPSNGYMDIVMSSAINYPNARQPTQQQEGLAVSSVMRVTGRNFETPGNIVNVSGTSYTLPCDTYTGYNVGSPMHRLNRTSATTCAITLGQTDGAGIGRVQKVAIRRTVANAAVTFIGWEGQAVLWPNNVQPTVGTAANLIDIYEFREGVVSGRTIGVLLARDIPGTSW